MATVCGPAGCWGTGAPCPGPRSGKGPDPLADVPDEVRELVRTLCQVSAESSMPRDETDTWIQEIADQLDCPAVVDVYRAAQEPDPRIKAPREARDRGWRTRRNLLLVRANVTGPSSGS